MSTDAYFHSLKHFQDARAKINADYQNTMKRLESARGSIFFDTHKKKAVERRMQALEKERADAERGVKSALARMRGRLKGRKLTPPTDEQIKVLRLLRDRETLSQDEFDKALQTLRDNDMALVSLEEIRKKHGLHGDVIGEMREFPTSKADELLSNMEQSAARVLRTSATRGAEMAAKKHYELYGGAPYDELTVTQQEPYRNKDECLRECAFLWSGTNQYAIDQFCDVVD